MSSRSKRNRQRKMPAKQGNTPTRQQNQSNQSADSGIMAMRHEVRVGPLPDPETLQHYEQVHPGIAERIIQRFEKEAEHRQTMENKIVDAQIEHQRSEMAAFRWGQFFAFAIAVVGLVASGIGVYHAQSAGQALAAASIGGVSLATLVGVFIYGRKTSPPEEDEAPNKDAKK